MRTVSVVVVLVCCCVFVGSCGSEPEADLYGIWVNEGSATPYVTFNEDGTWSAAAAPDAVDALDFVDAGPFTFDGETLTLTGNPGYFCTPWGEGTYKLRFEDDDTISMLVLEDLCAPRAGDLAKGLVRYSPEE